MTAEEVLKNLEDAVASGILHAGQVGALESIMRSLRVRIARGEFDV